MQDAHRLAAVTGDPNELSYLLTDKFRIRIMVEKNVTLGEWDLKQARRWLTQGFRRCAAVNKIKAPLL